MATMVVPILLEHLCNAIPVPASSCGSSKDVDVRTETGPRARASEKTIIPAAGEAHVYASKTRAVTRTSVAKNTIYVESSGGWISLMTKQMGMLNLGEGGGIASNTYNWLAAYRTCEG